MQVLVDAFSRCVLHFSTHIFNAFLCVLYFWEVSVVLQEKRAETHQKYKHCVFYAFPLKSMEPKMQPDVGKKSP